MNKKQHPKKLSPHSENKTEQDVDACQQKTLNGISGNEDRVYLDPHFPSVYFTKREMDCARELLTGKTVKDIAEALDLSPRSVEAYLRLMRLKLSANSKKELFCVIRDKTEISEC